MKLRNLFVGGLFLVSLAFVACAKVQTEQAAATQTPGEKAAPSGKTEQAVATQPPGEQATSGKPEKSAPSDEAMIQGVWKTVQAANQSHDNKAFISQFSPTYQMEMATRQAYYALETRKKRIGGSPARDAELQAEVKPVHEALDKLGLTAEAIPTPKSGASAKDREETMAKLKTLIKDPVVVWADLQTAFAKGLKDNRTSSEFDGDLINVKVDGDKATADIVVEGREYQVAPKPGSPSGAGKTKPETVKGGREISGRVFLLKVDGKWKLAPELRQRDGR